VRCIGRHIKSQDLVLKAEVLKLSCVVAAIAIKDQEPLLTIGMPCVLMEVLNPLESESIIRPAIITNSNLPGSRKASLVPFGLMGLCSKDNKWWDALALCIDSLDRCDLLSIAWLDCP
jgi:hypothetical protein